MLPERARAKVNLCLHVTGHRDDGLHDLQSLVVFPDIWDEVRLEPSTRFQLSVTGPFAPGLTGRNLIEDAAEMMGVTGHFHLTKNLPVASGIGGGSADAAAAIRLISSHFDLPVPQIDQLMKLGADVPVCVQGAPCVMSGAGEMVTPCTLPLFGLVLVNAGVPITTGAVFGALNMKQNPAMDPIPTAPDLTTLISFLQDQRNDLQAPAIAICPEIRDVIAALSVSLDCKLARMSGSGGTCFGLFESRFAAEAAAAKLAVKYPGWWVQAA